MTREIGVALVGYGAMGRAHAYAYRVLPLIRELPVTPKVVVLSGRDPAALERAAAAYGIADHATDWRAAVDRADVAILDICTPPGAHAEIAEAAAAAGKAVLCEKPLASTYADARRAAAAVEGAGVPNAVGFNYRRLPALALMRRLVGEGRVGEPQQFRARWLSDEFADPATPFDWRFDRAMGGTTIADLGSHLVDLAVWMLGDVAEVTAQSATFVGERPDRETGAMRAVEIDDASSALARFASGATGVFEMSRSCSRRPCDFTAEVNGTAGTLVFDYARLNELWYGDGGDDPELYGMRRIRAEHPLHPYASSWWPIGQGVGYGSSFVNQLADHLEGWPGGAWSPSFGDGLRVQAVCEAMERSAASGTWVNVADVEHG
ncbi:MAG TPA: Gfo/Idh/MocA family oxidoreductase [Gaiellales bacterium]|nr:Gfo/Idh/MocA family oxidoreductase [Gaiellales bacterium]